MDKIIKVDNKDIKFRATARTPRLYRALTMRDLIKDIKTLTEHFKEAKEAGEDGVGGLSIEDLTIFENVAYVMARHANPDMSEKNADDWLDSFDMFSVWEVLPQILELWQLNNVQTSKSKKK